MLRILVPVIALIFSPLLAQSATAQSAADLVKQAVAAQGGADALRALKTIRVTGDAKFWEPQQSVKAGGETRFLGDATFVISGDSTSHMVRVEWTRDQKYPSPEKLKYTETFTRTLGFVTDEKGSQPMSGVRLAAQAREIVRSSPTLLLFALENPKNVTSAGRQMLGTQSLPAIALTIGDYKFTVLFDTKTKLPAAVRTRDDDNILGDVNYDVVFDDWKAVGGVQIAHTLSSKVNDDEVARLSYKEFSVNPTLAADIFAVPDAVKAAAKPPAKENVPYQWVLRRIFLARFLDSDNIIFPLGGGLKLVELAPNVQHVQGGTANNLIVAMDSYLIVFDAPYGELQSRWVIDAAKAKYPGKRIRYLVLSHHHMDHSGGTRTFVAEGATIVVPAPDKAFFERTLKMPHTVVLDAQQKAPKAVKVVEVKDSMEFKDVNTTIRLMNIPNPHVDGMIIGHIVGPNLLYVTDLISPRGTIGRNGATVAVGEALRKANITGATIAGGHGTTAKQSDIAQALAAN